MKTTLFLLFQLFLIVGFGQDRLSKWIQKPSTTTSFTENLGRYDSFQGEEIKFFHRSGDVTYFFSKTSFIIGQQDRSKEKDFHEEAKYDEPAEPVTWNYFKITFEGTNFSSQINGESLLHHTSHFQDKAHPNLTVKAKNYKELIYADLYPNIDMVLTLPDEGGIKYTFHVKPGGDYNDIKMNYGDVDPLINDSGQLVLHSEFGVFTDIKPVSSVNENHVQSEFILDNNTISFGVADYDTSQPLVIDPWINLETSTIEDSFLSELGRYLELEITADNYGNCLILRDMGSTVAFYDNTGVLQWEWASGGGGPGDLTCNPATNEYYFLGFGNIVKLDVYGEVVENRSSTLDDPQEMFRTKYNPFTNTVVVGLGGVSDMEDHISLFTLDLTDRTNFEILLSPGSLGEDVAIMDLDPDDGAIYFLTPETPIAPGTNHFQNILFKVDPLDPTTIIWQIETDHLFLELRNLSGYNSVNGFNGIACGHEFLYTYDANKLNQYDKLTGDLVNSLSFPKEPLSIHGGLDTDSCDNVFVGTSDSVLIFDNELEFLLGYELPDSSCDLIVKNNWLYVSGKDFVTGIELPEDLCESESPEEDPDDDTDPDNDDDTATDESEEPEYLNAPNIFTPNSDNKNDVFTFEHLSNGIKTFHCVIINRWGVTVAELNHITDSWDGTDLNGNKCTPGTYFYKYEATTESGVEINTQGNVQLVTSK